MNIDKGSGFVLIGDRTKFLLFHLFSNNLLSTSSVSSITLGTRNIKKRDLITFWM